METHDQMDAGVAVPVLWGSDKWVFDSLGTLRTAMSDVAARCVDVRVTPRLFADLGPWLEANGAVNRGHTVRAGAPADLAVPAETWALDGRAFAALFVRDPDSDIVPPVPLPANALGVQVRIRPSGAPQKSKAVRVGKFFLPGVSEGGAPDEIGADELWRASEADPPSDAYDPMWFGPRLATGEPVYVASDEYRPIVKEKCAGDIFVFGGKTDRDYGAIGTTVWSVPIDVLTFGPVPTGAFSVIASNNLRQFRRILSAACRRTATVGGGLPGGYSGPAIDAYKQATRGFPVLRYCPDAIPTRQSA